MEDIEQKPLNDQPAVELQPPTSSANTIPDNKTAPGPSQIAGFWRRISAIVIDLILLTIPFYILGIIFQDIAFSLGPWGRIIGFGTLFVYWLYFNSRLGHGQTLGKKVMKTVVVDRRGNYLSISKAMLRAMILVLIGLLYGWANPLLETPIIAFLVSVIVFGGGLALAYGLVFNRQTRQGIHDLIIGSYVIKAPAVTGNRAPETPRIHLIVSYGILGLVLVISLVLSLFKGDNRSFGIISAAEWKDIQNTRASLLTSNEFFNVGVQRTNSRQAGSSEVTKVLIIQAWVKRSCGKNPEYCNEVIRRIAQTAFEQYKEIDQLSGMEIDVYNAFDLGLATSRFVYSSGRTIEDWRKLLGQ